MTLIFEEDPVYRALKRRYERLTRQVDEKRAFAKKAGHPDERRNLLQAADLLEEDAALMKLAMVLVQERGL